MKYSVYGEARVISRALNGDEFLQVPRGCLESAMKVLKANRLNPVIDDKRYAGVPIEVSFKGELREDQKPAVADLKKHDMGILAAGTAFGKTVVASYMIAERRVNTLTRQSSSVAIAMDRAIVGISRHAGEGDWAYWLWGKPLDR